MDLISLKLIHSYSDYMSSYQCTWPGHLRVMHIHISKKILPDDQVEGFLLGEYRVEAQ
jgi:hypothetical protein